MGATWQPVVLESSGIKSIADLKGKKVALGAPGSPSKFGAIAAMEAYGVKPGDYKDVYLTYTEMVEALQDGTIDCSWVVAPIPTSSMLNLSSSSKVRFLPIEDDKFAYIKKHYPYYSKTVIPANTYSGQNKPVPALGCMVMLMTNADVPEKTVYLMAKTIMEHTEELGQVHKAGYEWNLESATEGIAIPYHPGAEKYLKEKGKLK